MPARLQLRLQRIHDALTQTGGPVATAVKPVVTVTGNTLQFSIDFREGKSDAELANHLGSLIAAVASVKDHLKVWCAEKGIPFGGETLINTNRDVAIIHDLWNRDKHGELSKSRSGLFPSLAHILRGAVLKTPKGGGHVAIRLNPVSLDFATVDGDPAHVETDAIVVDAQGATIGSLLQIAERAIRAWEIAVTDAGVPLPPPPGPPPMPPVLSAP
jgi:hypothetical protein